MADKKRKGEVKQTPTEEEEEIKSRGSKNAAIAAKNAAKRLEAARIAAEEAARIAAEEKAAMKKRATGKKGNTVGQNLSSNLAAAVSSDATDVGKSKQVKKTSQKAFVPVSSSVSSVKTPKQLEEEAYNGILERRVQPARSVIQGDNPNLLITRYSDDPVVTAINSATLHNQFAIQSTFGHESWEYNLLKLPPRKIKKSGKIQEVETAYDQTVRIQTLELLGGPGENLLKIQGMPIKSTIAFQQQDNNPNGVLAVALTKALDYLVINQGQGQFMLAVEEKKKKSSSAAEEEEEEEDAQGNQGKVKVTTYTPDMCRQLISQIKNASRGDAKEKNFCDSLLKAFYLKVIYGGINSQDKMIAIIGVYGSFLNKGLSDTAQGGELIKVWLLKFMEKFKNGHEPLVREEPRFKYWDTTCGIPYLKLISSDKIASALYIRLINLFRGGMTSIQPYKSGGGESSVFYLPKKYVGLIIAMTSREGSPPRGFLNKFYDGCMGGLLNKLEIPGGSEYFENLILKINEIIQCLYGLIPNSDYMNIYDIIRVLEENQDAIIAYLTNEDSSVLPEYMQQNIECIDLLFKAKGGLYNALFSGDTEKDKFDFRMRYLHQILDCFGIFIQELSEHVRDNEAALEGLFDRMQGQPPSMSQAYSMIAETVGYYDNCMFLRGLSLQGCVQKYLEVCQEEPVCSFADVNYGHDQDIDHDVLQKLGEQFMLILCNGDPKQLPDFMRYINRTYVQPPGQRYSRDKKYDVNEDEISKIILDEAGFVSICQLGTEEMPNQITFKKTNDYRADFINNHQFVTKYSKKFKIGPVCGKIFTSIDFYVGKPLEIESKTSLHNEFNEFDKLLYFIVNPREQEVKTVANFADLAAPPGCVFASVGNMAISYKTFLFQGRQYIYEISTFDLGGNRTTNDNKFEIGPCLVKNTGDQFTQIFTPDELESYQHTPRELGELYNQLGDFSRNLFNGVKSANDIDRFFGQIEDFVKKNPQLRDNTSVFYKDLLKLIDNISILTNDLDSLIASAAAGGKTATKQKGLITKIKNIRVESFVALKSLLNERYKEIYETLTELQEQRKPIPPEIVNEIRDITTFLRIVNKFDFGDSSIAKGPPISVGYLSPRRTAFASSGVNTSPMASASQSNFVFGRDAAPSSPTKLSGQAATFVASLQPNMGHGEDVLGFGDPGAAELLALRTPQRTGLEKKSHSISSVSSAASSVYGSNQKAQSFPFWYYMLTEEPLVAKWFEDKLGPKIIQDALSNTNKLSFEDVAKLCTDMATVYCFNLSKAENKSDCIKERASNYLQRYYEGELNQSRFWSENIKKDIKKIKKAMETINAMETKNAMETEAGGAKRTRKHKLNKNRRKTKHINRKRKTKRLIKNKRRLTKKR